MPSLTLKQICDRINGMFTGKDNPQINFLVTDSRNLISPNDSLFFAIKGERHDGHHYIEELYLKRNLKNFVVETIPQNIPNIHDLNFIVVNNSLHAMQQLATSVRQEFKGKVIGITGSNGKTIVKEWLYQLLHTEYSIIRSPKSYNSQVGVPLSVWNLEPTANMAIFEAGISQLNEMNKLAPIIKPEIGIFTNIGEAHQENFSSINQKVAEKIKLFEQSKVIVYCFDHKAITEAVEKLAPSIQRINWSYTKECFLKITEIKKQAHSTLIKGIYNQQNLQISIPFTDDASIENAIHCWATLLYLRTPENTIKTGMQALTPVAMRLELKKGINNCTIINDSYNSDIHSLEIALDFLNQQHQHAAKTLILSDILQSGEENKVLYKRVATLINDKKISRFIGIGESLCSNAILFKGNKEFYHSTYEFLNQLHEASFNNEAILIKGARNFEFEKISSILEYKTHRTILEINLSAMIHNLNYFRSKLNPSTKIMVMVKAFSYGSGTFEIANMLEYQKVDYLAVAFADEGVALRQAGITTPIAVMNPEEDGFRAMVEYRLEPEIYSFTILDSFTKALRNMQADSFPVHIKLDTGMHRLGFMNDELDKLCNILSNSKEINVISVFSHLAGSDESVFDSFTRQQISRFTEMSDKISKIYPHKIIRHILNSSGIERFSEFQFEMVRLGIGLYGINPANQSALKNVSTLKTTVSQVKNVAAGETVGYSRKGKADTPKTIAVIPIGYADGFSRKLGNGKLRVLVKGHLVPTIGNVCMDMCMVDVTGKNIKEGDEVEIFGNNISLTEVSDKLETIPYEVLTSISARVKRIYIQE